MCRRVLASGACCSNARERVSLAAVAPSSESAAGSSFEPRERKGCVAEESRSSTSLLASELKPSIQEMPAPMARTPLTIATLAEQFLFSSNRHRYNRNAKAAVAAAVSAMARVR